ncbi:hypothetical protein RUM43_009177 [Polyplax serrata]|uniref:Uncharacterized protein n=1 Tax=Polyplax serrata TaxID=468196 RepID=A0AAN8NUY0_POLSC
MVGELLTVQVVDFVCALTVLRLSSGTEPSKDVSHFSQNYFCCGRNVQGVRFQKLKESITGNREDSMGKYLVKHQIARQIYSSDRRTITETVETVTRKDVRQAQENKKCKTTVVLANSQGLTRYFSKTVPCTATAKWQVCGGAVTAGKSLSSGGGCGINSLR